MALSLKVLKRCPSCDEDCKCGCQSNIYSLPVEVLEQILEYEDPITLLSLERTCKLLLGVVSCFWATYCRRKGLGRIPTPLPLRWTNKEDSVYSYDNAVQISNDPHKKWRIIAVRSFLRENKQCIYCTSYCGDDASKASFVFGEDVLLCFRCAPHFSIMVTHDLIHILTGVGVDINRLHIAFGPMLISNFIEILRSNNFDDVAVMEALRSHVSDGALSLFPNRMTTYMPLSVTAGTVRNSINTPGQRSLCTMTSRQQGCCCSARQCSSTAEHQAPPTVPVRNETYLTRHRRFFLVLFIVLFCKAAEIVYSAVIVEDYKLISIGSGEMPPFLMLAIIDISLVLFLSVYVIWNCICRLSKTTWNQSFSTIIKCFLLACFLVELCQCCLIMIYMKNIGNSTKQVFISGIPLYNSSSIQRDRIDWIQNNAGCCGFSGNATADWLLRNTSATSILPHSCCSSTIGAELHGLSSGNCSIIDEFFNLKSCPTAVDDALSLLLTGYMLTTMSCCIAHLVYLIYLNRVFHSFRSMQRNNASIDTIFTIT